MHKLNLFHNPGDIQHFKTGTTIFLEGEVGRHMYDIIEGEVDLIYAGEVLDTLGPGEIFGETGLIDNAPHSVTAVAHSDCRVAMIDKRRFMFMVDQTPHFALHVMQILTERLRRETRRKRIIISK